MSKHKPIRLDLYEKYNHRCAYCGCELECKDMQIDHIKSVYINTDINRRMKNEEMYNISNLLPSCRQCNFYKSTMDIEDFRERLKTTLWNNLKKNFNYKLALKYGLIKECDILIVFYYEKVGD